MHAEGRKMKKKVRVKRLVRKAKREINFYRRFWSPFRNSCWPPEQERRRKKPQRGRVLKLRVHSAAEKVNCKAKHENQGARVRFSWKQINMIFVGVFTGKKTYKAHNKEPCRKRKYCVSFWVKKEGFWEWITSSNRGRCSSDGQNKMLILQRKCYVTTLTLRNGETKLRYAKTKNLHAMGMI